jgi:hypothetical protein
MKKITGLLFLTFILTSCLSTRQSAIMEDELFLSRKYVGDFAGYRNTMPARFGDPHLIWIKTSLEEVHGEISAFSKTCDFRQGDRLYIRKSYSNRGGIWGDWTYHIETDSSKSNYIVSQFRLGEKILVQTWF